ncbi:MAG: sigma-70 family RNA polymerase sigma factor [Verrucomicrobia bacterium]|nr:sigma-70 family RNA polymerase sigma factor [Verrucomicrobiota bacterium]
MAAARSDDAAQAPGWGTMEELFAALESPLLGYALRIVGDRSTAEDLVQEAFMKLHAQFEDVREPERWLYRTVHNLALNHRRDNARMSQLTPLPADSSRESCESNATDESPLPDEQIARAEGIGLVRLSLKTLDKRSREIVHLKFNEDLSYAEISKRTGLKTGHVGYLLHHALKTIAVELAKTGMTKP